MHILTPMTAVALFALAACNAPDPAEQPAAATPATASESAQGSIEPGMGSPPEAGAGVPGSSNETSDVANPDGTNADPVLPRETPNP